jgi:hypothetical protein
MMMILIPSFFPFRPSNKNLAIKNLQKPNFVHGLHLDTSHLDRLEKWQKGSDLIF